MLREVDVLIEILERDSRPDSKIVSAVRAVAGNWSLLQAEVRELRRQYGAQLRDWSAGSCRPVTRARTTEDRAFEF
jgi:hypothetical protein